MSNDKTPFRCNYGYLEDLGLRLFSKQNMQQCCRLPPRVRPKYYRYTPNGASLKQLTSPDGRPSFPSPLYDSRSKLSYQSQLFVVLDRLGEGSYGTAFRVSSKEDGRTYAIKVAKEPFRNDAHRLQRLEEVKWQEQLSVHKNILKLYSAWEESNIMYMQMELCKMTLSRYAMIHQNDVTELVVWDVMIDMLLALKFMHGKCLLHLDVKLDNILVGYDGLYKLGDFGLVHKTDDTRRDPLEGDPKYMAPELMRGKFSDRADIFSLGISLMELACNVALPNHGAAWRALRQNRLPRTQTEDLSVELCNTMSLFMKSNYLERPSAARLLEHPEIEKRTKARNKKLLYEKISNTVWGAVNFLFTPAWTMYQNLVSVLSLFLPRNVPSVHIEEARNECNRTPTPTRNRPLVEVFSPMINTEQRQIIQDTKLRRRNLLSPTVRRNLAASFSSESE